MRSTNGQESGELSWHQRRGLQRSLGIHRLVSDDDGVQCLVCGRRGTDEVAGKCNPDEERERDSR